MDLTVLDATPEAGDADAIDGLVAGFAARAERFAERGVGVRSAGGALLGATTGAWSVALGERAERLGLGLDDAARGCRQVAEVLAGYASELRALGVEVRVRRDAVQDTRLRAAIARERYAAAVLAGGGVYSGWSPLDAPPFPAVPTAAPELRMWRAAVADAAEALRAFEACCRRREALDRVTAGRLASAEIMTTYAPGSAPGGVLDVPVVQALTAAGAGTVTAGQARRLAAWFAGSLDAVADGLYDARALAAVTDFTAAWGDDPLVMAGVVDGIGSEGVVALLTTLGGSMLTGDPARNRTMTSAAQALRGGVATASATWSAAKAREFADGLVAAARRRSGGRGIVGFLFGDPRRARMGESLTVAMADAIERLEMTTGAPWREGIGGPGHGLMTAGGLDDAGVAYDPAARVLETLGQYPEAARDWLTAGHQDWSSPTVPFDRARLTYWFGTRDWGTVASDGFGGIGVLWAGVQTGPGEGDVARQVATINTVAFEGLAGNASLDVGAVSMRGSAQLAEAIAKQIEGLVVVGFGGDIERDEPVMWTDVLAAHRDRRIDVAAVDRTSVEPVMTAAMVDAAGRDVMLAATRQYQDEVLAAVDGLDDPAEKALDGVVTAWGAVDGATLAAAEIATHLRNEEIEQRLDTARRIVDVGVGSVIPKAIAAVTVDIVLDRVQESTFDRLTNGPPEGVGNAVHSAGSIRNLLEHALEGERDAEVLGGADVTGRNGRSADVQDVVQELVGDYQGASNGMRMHARESLESE